MTYLIKQHKEIQMSAAILIGMAAIDEDFDFFGLMSSKKQVVVQPIIEQQKEEPISNEVIDDAFNNIMNLFGKAK